MSGVAWWDRVREHVATFEVVAGDPAHTAAVRAELLKLVKLGDGSSEVRAFDGARRMARQWMASPPAEISPALKALLVGLVGELAHYVAGWPVQETAPDARRSELDAAVLGAALESAFGRYSARLAVRRFGAAKVRCVWGHTAIVHGLGGMERCAVWSSSGHCACAGFVRAAKGGAA